MAGSDTVTARAEGARLSALPALKAFHWLVVRKAGCLSQILTNSLTMLSSSAFCIARIFPSAILGTKYSPRASARSSVSTFKPCFSHTGTKSPFLRIISTFLVPCEPLASLRVEQLSLSTRLLPIKGFQYLGSVFSAVTL